MNSKLLILLAVAFTIVCSVSGKFVGHHHQKPQEENEQKVEAEPTESHHHHDDSEHHHGHHRHHHHHHHKFQCQGKDLIFSEEQKTAHKTCMKELKERTPVSTSTTEASEHKHHKHHAHKPDACFVACKFEKLNLVEDGELEMDAVDKLVESTFPKESREDVKKAFADCNSKHDETLSTDHNCKSYIPLSKCIWKSLKKVCKQHKADE